MIISILNKCRISSIAVALGICFCAVATGYAAVPEKREDAAMESPFGVLEFLHWNHAWNNYKYPTEDDVRKSVALMKEAGIGWVRVDFLWGDIEPKQGEFNFDRYDTIVKAVSEGGLKILGILHYSTEWASSAGKWNYCPLDNAFFTAYASKVIRRYKNTVKYWEVWNEPDSCTYWNPQDGMVKYCELLKAVYAAAKAVDPECKILNGGLANGIASVNRLYDNGAKDYFDIMNVHFFQNPTDPAAIKAAQSFLRVVHKIMARNLDGEKQIWLTEIGSPGIPNGVSTKQWWLGDNPNEAVQAAWVKDVYTELLKEKNVTKIFWAFFRDCKDHWKDGVDYFGLLRWDFSKKPAFDAYQACVKARGKTQ